MANERLSQIEINKDGTVAVYDLDPDYLGGTAATDFIRKTASNTLTAGTIPYFVSPGSLSDSILRQQTGAVEVSGNLIVTGNLTVSGSTASIDVENVSVKDNILTLASGNTAALTKAAGILVPKYDGAASAALLFDSTGTAYVGDITEFETDGKSVVVSKNAGLRPLATRNASGAMTADAPLQWDGTAGTIKTSTPDANLDNKTYGTNPASALTYGGTFRVPSYTVDRYGRLTAAGETVLQLPASDDTNTWRPVRVGGVQKLGSDITSGAMNLAAQTPLSISESSGTITLSHNAVTLSDLTPSARAYVSGMTFDGYGHVTGYTTGTETVSDTNTWRPVSVSGTALLGGGIDSGSINLAVESGGALAVSGDQTTKTVTLSHNKITTVNHGATSSRTYINGLSMDSYGHIAGYTTGTETVVDTHYTAYMTAANSATSTSYAPSISNPYINLVENGAVRSSYMLMGGGSTTIVTNASGSIIVSSPDLATWSGSSNITTIGQNVTVGSTTYNFGISGSYSGKVITSGDHPVSASYSTTTGVLTLTAL